MDFVFEDNKNFLNFIECPDINSSGIRRFAPAPIAVSVLHRTQLAEIKNLDQTQRYIIASGVNHHPDNWTGSEYVQDNTRKNIFHYLNDVYLKDLQEGRAMLLFDQCLEGYQTSWLWKFFHEECDKYSVPADCLIYVTGNVIAEEQYQQWADANDISKRMNVIPYIHFEADIKEIARTSNLDITFDKQIEYKSNNEILDFNCQQKRLRPHRIWFYKYLYDAGLLQHGMVSMNKFEGISTLLEGKTIDIDDGKVLNDSLPKLVYGKNNNELPDSYYITRLVPRIYLDTWVTVISESSFSGDDHTIFLSEKTFKPITSFHPFIIMGNKHSLKRLRDLGYKTFEGYIDESYDDLETWDRYEAIIKTIKEIVAIPNKIEWYQSMRPILEHNHQVLQKPSNINPAYIKLKNCYEEYFS